MKECMEIWKDIEGYGGMFQVSNKGRIKSYLGSNTGLIRSVKNKLGTYLSIVLCGNGLPTKSVKVHRLVANAFIPNHENKPEVNHKDGNKQNNAVENLEWVTRSENVQHAVMHNPHMLMGMNIYNRYIRPKTIQQFSMDGMLLAEYPNSIMACRSTGVCNRNILQVASGDEYKPGMVRRQAGGYIWRYRQSGGIA
jgi:hypothetical protein